MMPKRLGDLVGVLMALVTAIVLVYMIGVKANVWPSPAGGFWTF